MINNILDDKLKTLDKMYKVILNEETKVDPLEDAIHGNYRCDSLNLYQEFAKLFLDPTYGLHMSPSTVYDRKHKAFMKVAKKAGYNFEEATAYIVSKINNKINEKMEEVNESGEKKSSKEAIEETEKEFGCKFVPTTEQCTLKSMQSGQNFYIALDKPVGEYQYVVIDREITHPMFHDICTNNLVNFGRNNVPFRILNKNRNLEIYGLTDEENEYLQNIKDKSDEELEASIGELKERGIIEDGLTVDEIRGRVNERIEKYHSYSNFAWNSEDFNRMFYGSEVLPMVRTDKFRKVGEYTADINKIDPAEYRLFGDGFFTFFGGDWESTSDLYKRETIHGYIGKKIIKLEDKKKELDSSQKTQITEIKKEIDKYLNIKINWHRSMGDVKKVDYLTFQELTYCMLENVQKYVFKICKDLSEKQPESTNIIRGLVDDGMDLTNALIDDGRVLVRAGELRLVRHDSDELISELEIYASRLNFLKNFIDDETINKIFLNSAKVNEVGDIKFEDRLKEYAPTTVQIGVENHIINKSGNWSTKNIEELEEITDDRYRNLKYDIDVFDKDSLSSIIKRISVSDKVLQLSDKCVYEWVLGKIANIVGDFEDENYVGIISMGDRPDVVHKLFGDIIENEKRYGFGNELSWRLAEFSSNHEAKGKAFLKEIKDNFLKELVNKYLVRVSEEITGSVSEHKELIKILVDNNIISEAEILDTGGAIAEPIESDINIDGVFNMTSGLIPSDDFQRDKRGNIVTHLTWKDRDYRDYAFISLDIDEKEYNFLYKCLEMKSDELKKSANELRKYDIIDFEIIEDNKIKDIRNKIESRLNKYNEIITNVASDIKDKVVRGHSIIRAMQKRLAIEEEVKNKDKFEQWCKEKGIAEKDYPKHRDGYREYVEKNHRDKNLSSGLKKILFDYAEHIKKVRELDDNAFEKFKSNIRGEPDVGNLLSGLIEVIASNFINGVVNTCYSKLESARGISPGIVESPTRTMGSHNAEIFSKINPFNNKDYLKELTRNAKDYIKGNYKEWDIARELLTTKRDITDENKKLIEDYLKAERSLIFIHKNIPSMQSMCVPCIARANRYLEMINRSKDIDTGNMFVDTPYSGMTTSRNPFTDSLTRDTFVDAFTISKIGGEVSTLAKTVPELVRMVKEMPKDDPNREKYRKVLDITNKLQGCGVHQSLIPSIIQDALIFVNQPISRNNLNSSDDIKNELISSFASKYSLEVGRPKVLETEISYYERLPYDYLAQFEEFKDIIDNVKNGIVELENQKNSILERNKKFDSGISTNQVKEFLEIPNKNIFKIYGQRIKTFLDKFKNLLEDDLDSGRYTQYLNDGIGDIVSDVENDNINVNGKQYITQSLRRIYDYLNRYSGRESQILPKDSRDKILSEINSFVKRMLSYFSDFGETFDNYINEFNTKDEMSKYNCLTMLKEATPLISSVMFDISHGDELEDISNKTKELQEMGGITENEEYKIKLQEYQSAIISQEELGKVIRRKTKYGTEIIFTGEDNKELAEEWHINWIQSDRNELIKSYDSHIKDLLNLFGESVEITEEEVKLQENLYEHAVKIFDKIKRKLISEPEFEYDNSMISSVEELIKISDEIRTTRDVEEANKKIKDLQEKTKLFFDSMMDIDLHSDPDKILRTVYYHYSKLKLLKKAGIECFKDNIEDTYSILSDLKHYENLNQEDLEDYIDSDIKVSFNMIKWYHEEFSFEDHKDIYQKIEKIYRMSEKIFEIYMKFKEDVSKENIGELEKIQGDIKKFDEREQIEDVKEYDKDFEERLKKYKQIIKIRDGLLGQTVLQVYDKIMSIINSLTEITIKDSLTPDETITELENVDAMQFADARERVGQIAANRPGLAVNIRFGNIKSEAKIWIDKENIDKCINTYDQIGKINGEIYSTEYREGKSLDIGLKLYDEDQLGQIEREIDEQYKDVGDPKLVANGSMIIDSEKFTKSFDNYKIFEIVDIIDVREKV